MKAVFLSNYINHHQIPFCSALHERLGEDFRFIQTEPMEQKRLEMGWSADNGGLCYVVNAYEKEEECRRLIDGADLFIAGWTKRLDLLEGRLDSGKLTLRISERIYREGQWKAVSPRGLISKYREHIRYRKRPVYLLCAGAYAASDFSLIHAYPGKKFKFGYFPETRIYEEERLFQKKARGPKTELIWAGRMISLKHPEFAVRLAEELKRENRAFHIHFVGAGPMEEDIRREIVRLGLTDHFTLYGYLKPEKVRDLMEGCHIHLFTSNYLEGWGAVVNEAMNAGCCVVANDQTGAAPWLIQNGENGLLYEDGSYERFALQVKRLLSDRDITERMGRAAYRTIVEEWNAERAATGCIRFYDNWKDGRVEPPERGPFSVAPVIRPAFHYKEGKLE